MKPRIFIVAPSGEIPEDHRHDVCRTFSRNSSREIYVFDKYELIDSRYTLKGAINLAKKHGAKKPTII